MKTLIAKETIRYGGNGQTARPGEELILPDSEADTLIAGGAAQIVERAPSELASLGSAELRRRQAALEQRVQVRRDTFAERTELGAAAKRELAALYVRAESGEDVRRDVAKAEARADELERGIRSAQAALENALDLTRSEEAALIAALGDALALEEQERREDEAAATEAARIQARKRTMRAFLELAAALAADELLADRRWRFADEFRQAIDEVRNDPLTRRASA